MAIEPSHGVSIEVLGVSLSDDVAAFAVDGMRPGVVASPATQEEVAAVLAAAHAAGAAVVPWGGGTHMALGMPPERYDVALDLRGVKRIVEYEPADLTVTVEAGMTLAGLQSVLGAHGQWLPLDPPCAPQATIGGILATNASGPARHSKGTARDLVIGMQFVTAEGSLVKTGGRVVKNVAGYDLGKLQIGALGTLGVITQATFKVSPLPAATLNLAAKAPDLESAIKVAKELGASRLPVQGMALVLRGGSEWSIQVRFAAGHSAVERSRMEAEALCKTFDLALAETTDDGWLEPLASLHDGIVARASVAQSKMYELLSYYAAISATVVAYPSAGTAQLVLRDGASAAAIGSLRGRCVDAGGALVIERAPLELKRSAGVWGEPRGDFALMQRLKAELDPGRVLNPGRFLGGI